jgi:hypothetical protein
MTRNFLRALTGWAMLVLTGCGTLPMGDTVRGPVYAPANVHRSVELLPITMRRVALLPATARIGEVEASGADAVSGLLLAELQRQHRLEVFHVNHADLARWSGRRDWAVSDQLPADFLESVRKHTGAEAVLFPEITTYRAYPPLAIGLRMTLVEVQSARVLWAVDDLLDAGNPQVSNGARQFYLDQMKGGSETPFDSQSVLDSPRRFSRYVIATLLGTMPDR